MRQPKAKPAASDLARIAELSGITVKQARIVRETIFRMFREAALRREPVRIRGFGAITYKHWKECRRGNPEYGGYSTQKARWHINFTPYPALDYLLNPQEYQDADKQSGD